MKFRLARVAALTVLSVLALLTIAAAAVFWRLSSGPISLDPITASLEDGLNKNLGGVQVKMGSALLEFEAETFVPHVRFQNIVVRDTSGNLLASAPKAAVTLDRHALLWGDVVPVELELIGPSVRAQRNLDGSFELGISGEAADESEETSIDDLNGATPENGSSKSDFGEIAVTPEAAPQPGAAQRMMQILADPGSASPLSRLQEIRISKARITLNDELNDASWLAPGADVVFRRMPFGFVSVVTADVVSSAEPWRAEMSISYRRESGSFLVSTRVTNIVPANVAAQIYALAQFAKVETPLSGNVDLEIDSAGNVTKGESNLQVSPGVVNFPNFISQPVAIGGGTVKLVYNPAQGFIEIVDANIMANGTPAGLAGRITPQRNPEGRLESYRFSLSAASADAATADAVIDRIDFTGSTELESQRLTIEDLVVMSGTSGLRMRGEIVAGEESAGLQFAGRLKNTSAAFMKRLWPPIMAPNTLAWIKKNIDSGQVSDGTFHVKLAPEALAEALRRQRLPDGSIDVQLELANVKTRYFKSLPSLENAFGRAHIQSNAIDLTIAQGHTVLPSGQQLVLNSGSFTATDILVDEVPGTFKFDISTPISGLSEFLEQPDLAALLTQKPELPDITGNARAQLGLSMPLIKEVPRDRVQITTGLTLSNAGIANVVKGVDLTEGEFAIDFTGDVISVSGPAKLNGIASKIDWKKPKSGGAAQVKLETTLTPAARQKLNIALGDYATGDIPVVLEMLQEPGITKMEVSADLSDVAVNVPALGWKREPRNGTKATFKVEQSPDGSRAIKDLLVTGDGLKLAGNIDLRAGGGVKSAEFSEIKFEKETTLAARIVPHDDGLDIRLAGYTLDARPYIQKILTPANAAAASNNASIKANLNVSATFEQVFTFRGEVIRNANAEFTYRSGQLNSLVVDGKYASTGQPVSMKLLPTARGRSLTIESTDGGSTMRAGNFYSKIAGGKLSFSAQIDNAPGSPIRNGLLRLTDFSVRDETALSELDKSGKPKKTGQRRSRSISFKRLSLPFSTDQSYVYLPEIELKGNELGAVAKGKIRKSNGGLAITGTIIPAQGINGAFDDIPLFGAILSGGDGEGIFGITFAMGGTTAKPKWQVNPISALAPGIFRKFFEFQTPKEQKKKKTLTKPGPY